MLFVKIPENTGNDDSFNRRNIKKQQCECPLGDPVAYQVLDTVIALRRSDAACIEIT